MEYIPLPSQKAEITAKAAVDAFFSRFNFPFQLISDKGRYFESKLFESLCKASEIHKARTTPYRPSANVQVERFNRLHFEIGGTCTPCFSNWGYKPISGGTHLVQ